MHRLDDTDQFFKTPLMFICVYSQFHPRIIAEISAKISAIISQCPPFYAIGDSSTIIVW